MMSSGLHAGLVQVGANYPQTTISQGLEVSTPGDTLMVHSGTYRERALVVPHQLTLIGQNNPVIDGNFEGEILTVTADNVTIEGITFKGSGLSHLDENAAIRFEETQGGRVSNNIFEDNFFCCLYLSIRKMSY